MRIPSRVTRVAPMKLLPKRHRSFGLAPARRWAQAWIRTPHRLRHPTDRLAETDTDPPPIDDPNAPYLRHFTRFGPPYTYPLDKSLPRPALATPGWLQDLTKDLADPRELMSLRQDDWAWRFKPLYTSTEAWKRVWRKGKGLQAQGYFVRDNLLFKLGPYSDRLCIPCPDARIAILQRLHDSPMAGHCGRHKTAARI